ncbi:MAG: hypothetical protein K2X35_10775 [Bryobacteraceae bacterium]|nr:hypothetical protein [Bryobacteraceae bacterium]
MTLQRLTSAVLLLAFTQSLLAGLGNKDAKYVGGTWSVKQETEGKFEVSDPKVARFVSKKADRVEIPYDKITSLEYGQKAGRRIGATIGWGVTTLGLAALPMLLSKKRKHYLSIGYLGDDGKPQGAVLELGKDVTRATVFTLETRSGKQVEYESEEARKHIGN